MNAEARLDRAALFLSVIQFLFATTWVVYAIYLGDLLDRVGISRDHLIGFILLDQLMFAVSDTLMGYAADKIERLLGRLGPKIIAVNALSCLAFVLLPFAPKVAGADASPAVFTLLLVVWIATSSVLRAPPLVLLTKYAARPRTPRLAALSLLGLALGGAVAPYLGLALKGIDPAVPFVVTALSLVLATLALSRVERIVGEIPPQDRAPAAPARPPIPAVALLLIAIFPIAFGTQINAFLNSKPLYLGFTAKENLVLLLPLFWVGFKLLALPGAAAARRAGPIPILAIAAITGTLGLGMAATATSLPALIAAQILAGGAWGVVFTTGVSAAVNFGNSGREGLILGLLFTIMSLATFSRAALTAAGVSAGNAGGLLLPAPAALWLLGSLLMIPLVYLARRTQP